MFMFFLKAWTILENSPIKIFYLKIGLGFDRHFRRSPHQTPSHFTKQQHNMPNFSI